MRYFGHADAALTGAGADGGIDVRATDAVAQVKAYTRGAIPRDMLHRLYGAAAVDSPGASLYFFTIAKSYSQPAVNYANQTGMRLFRLTLDGNAVPANRAAEEALNAAQADQEMQREQTGRTATAANAGTGASRTPQVSDSVSKGFTRHQTRPDRQLPPPSRSRSPRDRPSKPPNMLIGGIVMGTASAAGAGASIYGAYSTWADYRPVAVALIVVSVLAALFVAACISLAKSDLRARHSEARPRPETERFTSAPRASRGIRPAVSKQSGNRSGGSGTAAVDTRPKLVRKSAASKVRRNMRGSKARRKRPR